jgi:hypothetical protein
MHIVVSYLDGGPVELLVDESSSARSRNWNVFSRA